MGAPAGALEKSITQNWPWVYSGRLALLPTTTTTCWGMSVPPFHPALPRLAVTPPHSKAARPPFPAFCDACVSMGRPPDRRASISATLYWTAPPARHSQNDPKALLRMITAASEDARTLPLSRPPTAVKAGVALGDGT